MTLAMYGIPNCDTIKKARVWLDARGIAYTFHDYKKLGADPARLSAWAGQVGWEALLNRSGTTFRNLPESERVGLDEARAIALMALYPSCIRRPVVEAGDVLLVGFKPADWEATLR